MSVYRVSDEKLENLGFLFKNWDETLIWSCLQGIMGAAWSDSLEKPESAQIVIGDFCFFAGEVKKELVRNRPKERVSDFIIMVPQDEKWANLIEEVYKEKAVKVTRYAIKKEKHVFDVKKLKAFTEAVSADYHIKLIDQQIYETTKQQKWSLDLCSQFESFEQYEKKGLGVVALYHGELVAGASSYTRYRDGIEIEIDTRQDHMRKGLALACGAKLILECKKRDLYASWDAQNLGSVALAEKLGYHFDKEYTAYEINGF